MLAALCQGTVASAPVERATTTGSPFWTCNVRVPAGTEALFIGLATFDKTAGARLMKLDKGSTVAAVGTLEQTAWKDREGNDRTGWRLTATEVLSVYESRKRRLGGEGDE